MDELPKDNVFNIFSRMPIKSLACLSCVCKEFCKYNNDPDLENIRVKDEPIPIMFQQSLGSNPEVHCKLSFLHTVQDVSSSSLKVKKDQVLDFWRKDSAEFKHPRNLVLGSCNGLILAYSSKDRNYGTTLAVINPLSKQCYELPPIKISSSVQPLHLWSGGIGFDYSTHTFKVVCVVSEKDIDSPTIDVVNEKLCTIVHDLRLGSWKKVSQIKSYPIIGEGVFANGCIHWLVDIIDYSSVTPIDEGKQVVWFDVKKEEYRLIDPPKRKEDGWINEQLVDLNGEVGYVYNNVEKVNVEVWILKEKEWVRYPLDQTPYDNRPICVSGCWNKEGDILLTCEQGKQMYIYSKKNGDLKVVDQQDEFEAHIRMYRNSLLSIHGINSNAYSIKR